MKVVGALSVLLGCTLAAGCASDDEPAPSPAPVSAELSPLEQTSITEAAERARELDIDAFAYLLFGEPSLWQQRFSQAWQATADCMVERGWVDFEPEPGFVRAGTLADSLVYREEYGYGVSTDFGGDMFTRPDDVSPNRAWMSQLTQDESATIDEDLWAPYDGAEPGCLVLGHRAAFGSFLVYSDRFSELRAQAQQAADADPAVLAATDDWSRCMADAGYDYDNEGAVVAELLERLNALDGSEQPESIGNDTELIALQRDEMSVAEDAQTCNETTGLSETSRNALIDAQLDAALQCPDCLET